jgi:hypothetical protein
MSYHPSYIRPTTRQRIIDAQAPVTMTPETRVDALLAMIRTVRKENHDAAKAFLGNLYRKLDEALAETTAGLVCQQIKVRENYWAHAKIKGLTVDCDETLDELRGQMRSLLQISAAGVPVQGGTPNGKVKIA